MCVKITVQATTEATLLYFLSHNSRHERKVHPNLAAPSWCQQGAFETKYRWLQIQLLCSSTVLWTSDGENMTHSERGMQ